jgi:hypothetical protein
MNSFSQQLTVEDLNNYASRIALARPYRSANNDNLPIEHFRLVQDADAAVQRLKAIEVDTLEGAALGRYGDIMAACNGLTMKRVGPVADQFRFDKAAISVIMGPYGSAKTTTGFQKVLNSCIWQPPCPDGIRRARWAIIRDTYGHLETNIMADWFMWFPKTEKNYNLRTNIHKLNFDIPLPNGEVMKLYLEVLFRAMDKQSAEEMAKGLSLTGAWLNEMDTLDNDVFKFLWPRVGRYKPPGLQKPGWSGMIGDMNAPEVDNWTYDFCVNKNIGLSDREMADYQATYGPNFKVNFHEQPGGLSADAENLHNLGDGYYQRMQIGMTDAEVRRFIHNEFGALRLGQPVYPEFNDAIHVFLGDMVADPDIPIIAGLDAGSTPAMVFAQRMPDGQLRILDELVLYDPQKKNALLGMGPHYFGDIAREFVADNYPDCRFGGGFHDPAADKGNGSASASDDTVWIDDFCESFGYKLRPGGDPGNRLGPRLSAVRKRLNTNQAGKPAIVISTRCRVLRQGFNNAYVLDRIQMSNGTGRFKDEPNKSDFSHVQDALQYLCLGVQDRGHILLDMDSRSAARKNSGPRVNLGKGYFRPNNRSTMSHQRRG